MKKVVIIPARYDSERFEGKPLADILGKPMIQYVYEQASKAKSVDETVVATDHQSIYDTVKSFDGQVIMTSSKHKTGTDRIAEAASKLEADIIINVQGDEPLIKPEMIDQAIEPLTKNKNILMGTLCKKIDNIDDIFNTNIVKVVFDRDNFALYFSRSPIPFYRDKWNNLNSLPNLSNSFASFKHIGLYVYQKEFLLKFSKLPQTPLEKIEKLEQLRALENGYKIKVVETEFESIGVDTPEDLQRVINQIQKLKSKM